MIVEGKHDEHIFHAVIVLGGPGAGKSYIGGKIARTYGLKVVNPDTMYTFIKEKNRDPDWEQAYTEPDRVKRLLTGQLGGYLAGRLGILYDGTGREQKNIEEMVNTLKELGYLVMILFVNTDIDIARKRNAERERSVPDSFLRQAHQDISLNLGYYHGLVNGRFLVLDNSHDGDTYLDYAMKYIASFLREPVPQSPAVKAWYRDNA